MLKLMDNWMFYLSIANIFVNFNGKVDVCMICLFMDSFPNNYEGDEQFCCSISHLKNYIFTRDK